MKIDVLYTLLEGALFNVFEKKKRGRQDAVQIGKRPVRLRTDTEKELN